MIGTNSLEEHAEVNAIRKYRRHPEYDPGKKIIMVVVKFTYDGDLKNSKPCIHCTCSLKKAMKNFNMKYIFYSMDDGEIYREKISELETNHICSGRRSK